MSAPRERKLGGPELEIESALSHYICEELLRGRDGVGLDENLLSEGAVDSLGMVRLIGFIEETFSVKVPPQDFTVENFRTVNVLGEYVRRSLDGTGGAGGGA